VVDEVLAVGDAEFQKKAIGKMQDVSRGEGRTVLFVSHNMGAVKNLCKTGVLLENGTVFYSGIIDDVVNKYLNESNDKNTYQKDGFIHIDVRERRYIDKIFKKIRFLNKNNEPAEHFFMMEPMTIEVELENTEKYPDADYGVVISNSELQRITSYATWMFPKTNIVSPKQIRIEIPSLTVVSGKYQISISAVHQKLGKYIDRIEYCAQFYVDSKDLYNSGRGFTSEYGLVRHEGNIILLDRPLS
jgi:lipopolysaccharide transport system ATP-binding protein